MMPAFCPIDAAPGEQAVYEALASSPGTEGWIVLHSLAIANHVRQIEGEADFVVIVPSHGILILEIKSHLSIDRSADGLWRLGNDKPTTRGPFQQAAEAMHSLRALLIKKNVGLHAIPVVSAAWFTHVRARQMLPETDEWQSWQVLDSEDLRTDAAAGIRRTLTAGRAHLDSKLHSFPAGATGPDGVTASRIAGTLRPRFEMAAVRGDLRRHRETQLLTFIEEQYLALDSMADNQAVLFTGPAGSGKTLLAMEAARREAAMGHSGRLICFNRFLGQRLASDLEDTGAVTVSTMHQMLLTLANVRPPADATSTFWEQDLPDLALEPLLAGRTEPCDFLIVDEIQDITQERYLDVLDLIVDGGFASGRILLFGDFEGQTIFSAVGGREKLRHRFRNLASHRLTENCRNLPRIGYQVNLMSRLQPGYRRFRRLDDGVDPTFVTYEAENDQSPQIVRAVRQYQDEGFELHEIIILSALRSKSSAETTTDPWLRQVLRAADGSAPRKGELRYCTIHAFKGLDAPAVVLTDIDRRHVPDITSMLYIGLTRATDRLTAVIESRTSRAAMRGFA